MVYTFVKQMIGVALCHDMRAVVSCTLSLRRLVGKPSDHIIIVDTDVNEPIPRDKNPDHTSCPKTPV